MTPRPPVPGDVLVEIPYDVQVQGDYHEVGRFLARVVSFPRVVRPTISELLQSEIGAVQGLTTAPPAAQPAAPGQPGGFEETGYEVLATMRLSTYVPLVVRSDVSSVLEGEPVASSSAPEEVLDES